MNKLARRIASSVGVLAGASIVLVCCGPLRAGQGTYPIGEIGGRVATVEGQPVLEIKEVYPDQPGAAAKLQPGMKIVGAMGHPFTDGYLMPLKQLGFALDSGRNSDGVLDLNVLVNGKVQTTRVRLSKAPSFSASFPFNCPRSDYIYDHVCEAMSAEYQAHGHLPGGPVTNSLAVMALLGHKSGSGVKVVEPYVTKVAQGYASGENSEHSVWLLSYGGVMLCEYFLIHPDKTVAEAIRNIARRLAEGIPSHGRYGHHIRSPDRDAIAYGGQGLNGTTTAALWFFASAARCGIDPKEIQPAFGKALERVRQETNSNGGVGYAWGGDHQSPMRSGQTALAWFHLVMSPQLVGPITSAHLTYRANVATWPTRHADDLLEAHAVSSLGITTSTAGLAAFDRQQYVKLMQGWRWYFALTWQPNPAKPGQFEAAYVGGPNNTGGDFYLNGHRPLEKDFCSIMNATVGFILAASHERLSFYGGMPPIPGLTTTVLAQSPPLSKAYMAMRNHNFGQALRLAVPLTKEVTEDGTLTRDPHSAGEGETSQEALTESERNSISSVAVSFIDFIDERVLAAQFDDINATFDGQDVALAHEKLRRFAIDVRGIRKYEIDVERMLQELSKKKYADRLRIGKRFYALKAATVQSKNLVASIKRWEKFQEDCRDEYYRGEAQNIVAELRQAKAFDEKWGDKDESGEKSRK